MDVADDMPPDEQYAAEARIEAQMTEEGGPIHIPSVSVTLFHKPTQRILPLMSALA